MAISHFMDCDDPDSPIEDDRRNQSVVLSMLIDEHPVRLSFDELVLVLHADLTETPRIATENALKDLIGAGLVRREGPHLLPTRAALYFAALDVD
jgi:hypothetical protein